MNTSNSAVRFISKARTRGTLSNTVQIFGCLQRFCIAGTKYRKQQLLRILQNLTKKVADQSLILNKNNFNFIEGDLSIYSLDYPKK